MTPKPTLPSSEFPSSARLFASLADGEARAADDIFHRYLQRLTRLARTRLAPQLKARTDPEDIVMSAYRSFFVGATADRFHIDKAGDLWALLATIAMRKLYRTVAHHQADKRSVKREQPAADSSDDAPWFCSDQPTPDEAVALSDELECLLASQTTAHRRILELRLQGFSLAEVAAEVGVAERTVRRAMQCVREQLVNDTGEMPKFEIRPSESSRPATSKPAENGVRLAAVSIPNTQAVPQSVRLRSFGNAACDAGLTYDFRDLTLTRMIGAGGMGRVYRAQQAGHDEPVAVKFLRKSLQRDDAAVELFLREARLIGTLSHPHIVPLHGIGRTSGGIHFLVMRCLEGRNVASLIVDGELPVERIQRWMLQVAAALQHAHSRNIVHCDLKPANVVINADDSAIVTDLGLAQTLNAPARIAPMMAGTAAWMAPEQIDEYFGPISERTDVYGFGALLYTLLTGQPPFSGRTVADVLTNVVSSRGLVPVDERRADVPPSLAKLCMACLQPEPARRPKSMAELLETLS